MKKQIFAIKKKDWFVTIQFTDGFGTKDLCEHIFRTRKQAIEWVNAMSDAGDKVQIFKLSYEFRDAWVVGEKKGSKK